jgi:GT2 family glycosyltransferase
MNTLTIAICTYNRLSRLKLLLYSLRFANKIEQTEIIIVDNSSDNQTNKFLNDHVYELNIKYYKILPKGLSNARNFAIKKTTSEYIVFFDDDCLVQLDCIAHLLKFLPKNKPDAFSGVVHGILPYNKVGCVQNSEIGSNWDGEELSYLPGNFLGVKTEIFDELGGFNEDFGHNRDKIGYGDDSMFEFKLRKAKKKIAYVESAEVFHYSLGFSTSEWFTVSYGHALYNLRLLKVTDPKRASVFKSLVDSCRTIIIILLKVLISLKFSCKNRYAIIQINGSIQYVVSG